MSFVTIFKAKIIKLTSKKIGVVYYKQYNAYTVKAFVVTPKMTKNSIIFRGSYDKGYKFFYS